MPSPADRLARALEALDKVLAEPEIGRAAAEAVLAAARDDEAAAVAYRALGLAFRETGDLGRALSALRRAITVAERAGARTRAAEARMTLIVVLSDRGMTEAALAEAALAAAVLTGVDRARLQVNWGLVLLRTGRNAEALAMFDASQPVLQAAGDTRFEALLLNMRGTLHTYEGRFRDGSADLLRGELLTRRTGQEVTHAMILLNLGYLARQLGDLPGALHRLAQAAAIYRRHGKRGSNLDVDRSDILLTAGLFGEARATVAAAIIEQDHHGFRYNLAEHHLMHARTALADGDPAVAEQEARRARSMFTRQRRALWADQARHAEVAARFA
ncbi:MAG: hypothetical protein HOV83_28425, partial [Catenulispora sp.]|nr:hypothetical protein [Catenulispora sp.]